MPLARPEGNDRIDYAWVSRKPPDFIRKFPWEDADMGAGPTTDSDKARRLARAICADLRLYHEEPMKVLVETGKAPPALTEAFEEARQLYRSRAVDPEIFERELKHLMLTGELSPKD